MNIKQEILAELIYKAETGALDKLTQEEINEVMGPYILHRYLNPDEAKKGVKDTLDSLQRFFNRLMKYFSMSEKEIQTKYDLLSKMEKLQATLPAGCDITDSDEVIKFARKLDKEYYNDSQAGVLLGVQRTTVKGWKDKNRHGLVGEKKGERNVISRNNLLKFYRTWKGKDWNF